MTDPSQAGLATQDPNQPTRWPWWAYATLGLFALGIAAALVGVRTCL